MIIHGLEMPSFYNWQNKYYKFENVFLKEDEIGGYLGISEGIKRSVYTIRNINSNISIAVGYENGYMKADFAFNDTINWNGQDYFINPNYGVGEESREDEPKIDKLIGKTDCFNIYSSFLNKAKP